MEKKIKRNEFSIDAGKMDIIEGKAKANLDKGQLKFFINEGKLTMQWKNITKNIFTEPIIINPGDWSWKKIGTSKGRVYMMQNNSNPEKKYLYYMQFPLSMDNNINTIISNIINSGNLNIDEVDHNKDYNDNVPMSIDEVNKNEDKKEILDNNLNLNNNNNNKNQSDFDFIKNFTASFQKSIPKYPKLVKLLTRDNIEKLFSNLNESEKQELIKLLPENQQNITEFKNNISSPQFQQSLQTLNHALNSENLQSIIQSFNLDLNIAQKYSNGVEAFIRCILKKFPPKEKK